MTKQEKLARYKARLTHTLEEVLNLAYEIAAVDADCPSWKMLDEAAELLLKASNSLEQTIR